MDFDSVLEQYNFVKELVDDYSNDYNVTREKTSELASQLSNLGAMLNKLRESIGIKSDGTFENVAEEDIKKFKAVNDNVKQLKLEACMAMDTNVAV